MNSFVSIGWSGGGPHALSTTLDSRCRGVVTLAGVGQYGKSDLDFLAGMGPENIDEFGVALNGEVALNSWMAANATSMQQVTGIELIEAFGGLIGDADKEVLAGGVADDIAETMRFGLSRGFTGWIDDDLAFVQDLGFNLGLIAVPVEIWQGEDDFMVPHTHSQWLANSIRGSVLHFAPGEGHFSLIVKHREEIVTKLKLMLG